MQSANSKNSARNSRRQSVSRGIAVNEKEAVAPNTRNNPPAAATRSSSSGSPAKSSGSASPYQRTYGVPAAVTMTQAIDESAWGQSALAMHDHNLFGIKGTGPAGSVMMSTQEFRNGQRVTVNAPFRAYYNVAESIAGHCLLLAGSGSHTAALASKQRSDAFANALTSVYATDPDYGTSLISPMRQYNLYRYDTTAATA